MGKTRMFGQSTIEDLLGYRNAADFTAGSSTAGIQEAIDDSPTNGGTVFVPSGVHEISAKITMDKPINIFGAGIGAGLAASKGTNTVLWLADGVDDNMFDVNVVDAVNDYIYFPSFYHIGLYGNKGNQAAGCAVNHIAGQNLQICDCCITQFHTDMVRFASHSSHLISNSCLEFSDGAGVKIDTATTVSTIRICNNHFVDSGTYAIYVKDTQPSYGIIATGNNFLTNGNNIYLENTQNHSFTGNLMSHATAHAIAVNGCNDINFDSNRVNMNGAGINGVYVFGSSSNIHVVGNHIYNVASNRVRVGVDTDSTAYVANNWGE